MRLVLGEDVAGAIGGSAVHHDIFNVGIALFQHRADGSFDGGGAVVHDRDEGDFHLDLIRIESLLILLKWAHYLLQDI